MTKVRALIQRLIQSLRRRKIAQKIALGYGMAIGIGVVGASFGLAIGSIYESQAARNRDIAARKSQLIFRLENDTLLLALHPQYLLGAAEEPSKFHQETRQFRADIASLRSATVAFSDFLRKYNHWQKADEGLAVISPLRIFLDDYELWIESLWLALRSVPHSSPTGKFATQLRQDRIAIFAAELSEPQAQELQAELEQLSEQLAQLGEAAKVLETQALEQLQYARNLRLWIVVTSLVCSTALAIAFALYISQAIAKPIRTLTAQTHRITEEENFALRVSVETEDETSRLAASIGQLVQWAGQYTQALEVAQATLEQRVEERTQELRIAQAQIIQHEKMSSLGQMVAGVAHEINNPVGFIYSNLPYATRYVDDLLEMIALYRGEYEPTEAIAAKAEEVEVDFLEEDIKKVLDAMKIGADRIKEIVLSLRTFSRLDEAEQKFANLQDGINSTLTILSHRFKAIPGRPAIEVVRDYGDPPLVYCYAGPLNQVFMNLIANAVDALEGNLGTTPTVSGQAERPQVTITTRAQGDRCIITIGDNGPGIPPEVLAKIFDPFFTTKPIGKGTGMGLAISYQIVVDRHGGQLTCDTKLGQGTTFTINLPLDLPMDESHPG